jgi:hypothetical protein
MALELLGTFPFDPEHQALFRAGTLVRAWAAAYPMLFSTHDVRLAHSQRTRHYFEWLAAVLLFHTQGLVSVQKYEFPGASREKSATLRALLGAEVCDWLYSRQAQRVVQCPDLLVFNSDMSRAYFCEVKGPTDQLRLSQREFFRELAERTGKPVKLLAFTGRKTSK